MSVSARERFLQAEKEKDKDKDKKDKEERKEKKDKKDKETKAQPTASWTDDELVADALKRGEWKEVKDEKSGRSYYYNAKTKTTTWDLKKDLRKQYGPPPSDAPQAAASGAPSSDTPQPAPAAAQQPITPPPSVTFNLPISSPSPSSVIESRPSAAASPPPPAAPTAAAYAAPPPPPAPQAAQQPTTAPFGPVGSMVPSGVLYQDPIQRLLEHNEQLQRLTVGASSAAGGVRASNAGGLTVAMDFQAKYDAMVRTNQALSAQLERTKSENDAMARSLVDAHKKIHELQMLLQAPQSAVERSREDELYATMAHLREANRVLVTQVGELSVLLARGLNESAARLADMPMRLPSVGDEATVATGATMITRFLDTAARHTLCPNCVLSVTRFRDKLLAPSETNQGKAPRGGGPVTSNGIAPAVPVYETVPDFTTPPPSHYFNAAQPQPMRAVTSSMPAPQVGSSRPAATTGESPAVLYGGFMVRNPRVPS